MVNGDTAREFTTRESTSYHYRVDIFITSSAADFDNQKTFKNAELSIRRQCPRTAHAKCTLNSAKCNNNKHSNKGDQQVETGGSPVCTQE